MCEDKITYLIIGKAYEVYNTLGYGFMETVYSNSLFLELQSIGLDCQKEYPLEVYYKDCLVGTYRADLVVRSKIIVELKVATSICNEHCFQTKNYPLLVDFCTAKISRVKAAKLKTGLLLNFGPRKLDIKRCFQR